jgi:lipoyl(octanoyl) transferase
MHGFAFNVSTDLSYFQHIVPCGISDRGVTSLKNILKREVLMEEVCERYIAAFENVFDVTLTNSLAML